AADRDAFAGRVVALLVARLVARLADSLAHFLVVRLVARLANRVLAVLVAGLVARLIASLALLAVAGLAHLLHHRLLDGLIAGDPALLQDRVVDQLVAGLQLRRRGRVATLGITARLRTAAVAGRATGRGAGARGGADEPRDGDQQRRSHAHPHTSPPSTRDGWNLRSLPTVRTPCPVALTGCRDPGGIPSQVEREVALSGGTRSAPLHLHAHPFCLRLSAPACPLDDVPRRLPPLPA